MVSCTLNLGTETAAHGQLQTYSWYRDYCSWSITHLFWGQRLLLMVNYTLNLGTKITVHGQLHS